VTLAVPRRNNYLPERFVEPTAMPIWSMILPNLVPRAAGVM
jgi:hypothetical protein